MSVSDAHIGPADSPEEVGNLLGGVRSLNNGESRSIFAEDNKS